MGADSHIVGFPFGSPHNDADGSDRHVCNARHPRRKDRHRPHTDPGVARPLLSICHRVASRPASASSDIAAPGVGWVAARHRQYAAASRAEAVFDRNCQQDADPRQPNEYAVDVQLHCGAARLLPGAAGAAGAHRSSHRLSGGLYPADSRSSCFNDALARGRRARE